MALSHVVLPMLPSGGTNRVNFALCHCGTGADRAELTTPSYTLSRPTGASPLALRCLFLLQANHFQDKDFPSFQVSEPLDQLSCVTTSGPPNLRWKTLRTLMKNGPQGSKVRGWEDSEVLS